MTSSIDDNDHKRLVRIESVLTRFVMACGYDRFGNPLDSLVLTEPQTEQVLTLLEDLLDTLADNTEISDDLYDRVEATYNRLLSLRICRWPTPSST